MLIESLVSLISVKSLQWEVSAGDDDDILILIQFYNVT